MQRALQRRLHSTLAIKTMRAPTLDEFRATVLPAHEPRLITDALSAWPALQRWRNFVRRPESASLVVPVEVSKLQSDDSVGAGYNSSQMEQIQMPYDTFIDAFMLGAFQPSESRYVGYLAQYTLLDDIPSLNDDVSPPPPYALSGRGDLWRTNVWIGTAGTWTPLHRDPYHNLFCQVVGEKHIRIFPPESANKLYLSHDPLQRNTSTLASPAPDPEQYPLFHAALPESWQIVARPGDMLFIPKGFYHSVEGLKFLHAVRWMHESRAGKAERSSLVLTVTDLDTARKIVHEGLCVLGEFCPTDVLVPAVRQCYRCLGFGHESSQCLKQHPPRPLACGRCASPDHATGGCTCPARPACVAMRTCTHVRLKCVNCGGEHKAFDALCPVKAGAIEQATQSSSYRALFLELTQ